MKRKKENPPKRSYEEVMEDFQNAQTPKEYRAVHKEMRQNHYSGVSIWYRYPHIDDVMMAISLLLSITALVVRLSK